jgi:hypothetical protein
MMDGRFPRNPPRAEVVPLRPGLSRLTLAWANACRDDPQVAALAVTCGALRPVHARGDNWVLEGLTSGGSVVHACITADNHLSIFRHGPDGDQVALRLPLTDALPEAS